MTDLAFQSTTDLANAIKSRKVQSIELLEHYIDRVQRYNPKINAIVATDLDNARKRSLAADKALDKGENWGVLHGLPMTIKDSFEVVGMPCTSGSPDLKDYQPTKNAFVVQKLLDEGAVIFGKTNLPLFAMDLQSYNEVYGQTNNPWDHEMVPGGSSGGAAAALAAGLTGLEMGSDIGGSIRNPAHFCGVFGHKPTFGIVPLIGHIPPPPGTYPGEYTTDTDIAVAGPMARSAKDLDLVMNLIAAPKCPQNTAWNIRLSPTREKKLEEFKIGLWLDDKSFPTDINVLDCLQNTVDALTKAGARIEERRPDIDFAQSHAMYTQLLNAATSAALPQEIFDGMLGKAKNLSDEDRGDLALSIKGMTMLHRDWIVLDYVRTMMRETWANFFKEYDILLCPTVSITAFPHDHTEDFFERKLEVNGEVRSYFDTTVAWAGLTGMAYLPSTIAPVGLAKNGLPVGIQIVAPYLEDRTSIHFAGLIEDIAGGFASPTGYE
ncbi:Amidase family protein SACE_5032 [Olavius sp. associated proteobacterium Delta 1]|nr:Amidase family protein SACE_5032 [Olavius sp. associated proteobacterium Delta 1]